MVASTEGTDSIARWNRSTSRKTSGSVAAGRGRWIQTCATLRSATCERNQIRSCRSGNDGSSTCTYSGTIWGTSGTYGTTFTPSATWSASFTFSFSVCGSVPRGQNPSVGTGYQDTVVATVNF